MIGDIHLKKISSSPQISRTKKVAPDSPQAFELTEPTITEDICSNSIHSVTIQELNQLFLLSTEHEKNKKGLQYGSALLDCLDKLKNQILLGMLDEMTLSDLKTAIDSRFHDDLDPKLEEIIQEIQVRVNVELAKFNVL